MPNLNSVTTGFFPVANKDFTDTLSSTTLEDATTISVNSATEYSNGEFAVWVIAPGTADQVTVTGEISGNDLTNVIWTDGTAAASYPAGTTVVDYVTATHFSLVTKGIREEHSEDGSHAVVTATSVTTSGDSDVGGNTTVAGDATVTGTVNAVEALQEDGIGTDTIRDESSILDFVYSGLNPSSATGLDVTVPSGVYYIDGKRYIYAGGTKTLSASKDCYLDIDKSGNIASVEVTNGATSGMTLTTDAVRFAKVVTGASSVSSYQTGGIDSLSNPIRPRSPRRPSVAFSVYRSSAQTYGGSGSNPIKVAFDTKDYDIGGNFDVTTNNRFTAPVAGIYEFKFRGGVSSASGDAHSFGLAKNGSVVKSGPTLYAGSSFNQGFTLSGELYLSAGDYVEAMFSNSVAGTRGAIVGAANTWFTGRLVA